MIHNLSDFHKPPGNVEYKVCPICGKPYERQPDNDYCPVCYKPGEPLVVVGTPFHYVNRIQAVHYVVEHGLRERIGAKPIAA